MKIIGACRRKCLLLNLEGNVACSYSFFFKSYDLECDFGEDNFDTAENNDKAYDDEYESNDQEDLYSLSLGSIGKKKLDSKINVLLIRLIKRATSYRKISYRDDLTLSDGVEISTPLVDFFSLTVNISISIKTLLNIKFPSCYLLGN